MKKRREEFQPLFTVCVLKKRVSYDKIQGWNNRITAQRRFIMSAVAASFLGYTFKFVCFGVIAYAGIICGKKFRDKKDADKAANSQDGR